MNPKINLHIGNSGMQPLEAPPFLREKNTSYASFWHFAVNLAFTITPYPIVSRPVLTWNLSRWRYPTLAVVYVFQGGLSRQWAYENMAGILVVKSDSTINTSCTWGSLYSPWSMNRGTGARTGDRWCGLSASNIFFFFNWNWKPLGSFGIPPPFLV